LYLWDEILDFWFMYGARVLLGALAVAAVVVGDVVYHDSTCCKIQPPLQCILLDASGSAVGARATYSNLAISIIESQSEKEGRICFVDVAGDPAAESDVETMSLGATNTSNSRTAEEERSENELKAKEAIRGLLLHPPLHVAGSAFVEALAIVGPKMQPGDTINIFSDGIQDSSAFKLRDLHKKGYSLAAIEVALDKLEKEGYLPRMVGVKVIFERPGFQGAGGHSIVTEPAIVRFWRAWGNRTGAKVSI
jgi:hypothetical protein